MREKYDKLYWKTGNYQGNLKSFLCGHPDRHVSTSIFRVKITNLYILMTNLLQL